jgi:membrane protein implicated in regulation of membrane protease activity
MLSFFISAAVVGLVVMLLGAFTGFFDSDHEITDIGHGEPDGLHISAIPFLSLRFWTNFLAAFGVIGICLYLLKLGTERNIAIIAGLAGLIYGLVVFGALRFAKKNQSGFVASSKDIVGKKGRVIVAIHGREEGKIRVDVFGDSIDYFAISEQGEEIPLGADVLIDSVEKTTVSVTNLTKVLQQEFE